MSERPLLLIVEDDRDAADYIARAFREVGHVAEQAADGEEGLALALELELGADILGTAVAPTWNDIGQLAAIAVLRTPATTRG